MGVAGSVHLRSSRQHELRCRFQFGSSHVLHHAGNGLTVARVVAQRLVDEARDLRAEARKVVVAIDDTMRRLRALEHPQPQSTQGAPDARQPEGHER